MVRCIVPLRATGVLCTAEGPTFNYYIQQAIRYGPRVGSSVPLRVIVDISSYHHVMEATPVGIRVGSCILLKVLVHISSYHHVTEANLVGVRMGSCVPLRVLVHISSYHHVTEATPVGVRVGSCVPLRVLVHISFTFHKSCVNNLVLKINHVKWIYMCLWQTFVFEVTAALKSQKRFHALSNPAGCFCNPPGLRLRHATIHAISYALISVV